MILLSLLNRKRLIEIFMYYINVVQFNTKGLMALRM